MTAVLDASIAMSWFFEDEAGDHEVLRLVTFEGANVPSIWRLEVASALQSAVRRRRMDPAARDEVLESLRALPITVDQETDRYAWSETLRLADRFGLTIYDATYLELARRLALPLATRDRALAAAARASSLDVIGDA